MLPVSVAVHDLDHLAVALHIAALGKRRHRFNASFHFREHECALQLGIRGAVYFAARFALGTEEVTQCKAS
jgi:hypothetical protein